MKNAKEPIDLSEPLMLYKRGSEGYKSIAAALEINTDDVSGMTVLLEPAAQLSRTLLLPRGLFLNVARIVPKAEESKNMNPPLQGGVGCSPSSIFDNDDVGGDNQKKEAEDEI